ncbi:heme NO-binding domain-containing protein [uncultured Aliiroseovarius sp.]|uniref:heme NO-binding domain-containing protein n=1 Tax=uncultured Aliiroseovarius sp. TaxID=1658783 RepID=UPI00263206CE|nr:heme NO-binding domain-containing protein [uncultured Aliiroseovarius sp.]
MHGLILWSFERFMCLTYGHGRWRDIMRDLDLSYDSFVPMFRYEASMATAVVDATAAQLEKPRDMVLEDFGTFLVTDDRAGRVRRLLRFGGTSFVDFLHSLEDLSGRAQLAVPDLDLPVIELDEIRADEYVVTCRDVPKDLGHVLLGVLRALADDYGTLAFLEHLGREDQTETLSVHLLAMQHGEGRAFQLAMGGGT